MNFVCPLPGLWMEVYEELHDAWTQGGRKRSPPPRPPVLGVWDVTNDVDKKRTWEETLNWAAQRGLQHLIPEIAPNQSLMVFELTNWERMGPFGGPLYLEWDFSSKVKPSEARLKSALFALTSNWARVAGSELAAYSKPLRFTGNKRRHLLVQGGEQLKAKIVDE